MQIQSIKQNIYINNLNKNVKTKNQSHSTLPSYDLSNHPDSFSFKAKMPQFEEFRQVMKSGEEKAFKECKAQIKKLTNPKEKAKKAIAFIAGLGTTLAYDVVFCDRSDTPRSNNLMELFEIASTEPDKLVKTMLKRYKLITEESIPNYAGKIDYRVFKFTRADYRLGCVAELDYNQINKIFSKEPKLLTDLYLGTKDGFGIMHLLSFIDDYKYQSQALMGFYNVIKSSPELVNRLDREIDNYYCRYSGIDDTPMGLLLNIIKYSQFVQKTPAETDKDKDARNLALNFTCEYVKENPEKFMEDAKKVLDWNPDVLNEFLNTRAADGGAWPRYNSDGLIRNNILKPDSYNKIFRNHPEQLIYHYLFPRTFEYLIKNHKDVLDETFEILKENPSKVATLLKKTNLSRMSPFGNEPYSENYRYGKNYLFNLIKIAAQTKNLTNAEDMESILKSVLDIKSREYNSLNEPFDSNGDSLLFKILDIKANDKKSNEALDRIFKKLSQINFSYSYGKNINLDTQDGLGFSFLEKSIFFENERGVKLWRDSNPRGRVYYTPNLDFAVKSCENSDFKNYVLRVLDCNFIDLYKAVKLCSLEAIKKFESQFESPLYTEDSAKDLWDIALHTYNKEFCKDFYKGYQKYLPPNAFDDLMNM